ncbi:phosphotransferase [Actinomadura sp. ATCC 31491]|uniref:Phosphotransferase n=1 Tax=Actinomadura luzonensis TaxID=2805427 RepID=A0ABT0FLS2_9ACTN|nr:phosphotransferase [Actinomadura luzonensis]MCK2213272.1 phosphotransferase [Actinomadura luzonensis]
MTHPPPGHGTRPRRASPKPARHALTRRATAAALALARRHGLPAGDDPAVLGNVFSLTLHLRPAPVVARVATRMPRLRSPIGDWLRMELEVTAYLAAQGAPVVSPSAELPPGPHLEDGFAISFWTWLEPDPDRVATTADCAAMLGDLHAVLRTYPGELPLMCANDVPRGLALLDATGDVLSPAEKDLVRSAAAELAPFMAAPPGDLQPLHGDAYPANLLATRRAGLVWIDFEDVCRGPVEWDLATMMDAGVVRDLLPALAAHR